MRVFAVLAAVWAFATGAHAQPAFEMRADKGPNDVGFRLVQQFDQARAFRAAIDPITGSAVDGERARPIQTLIWYPSSASGQKLRFDDYLRLSATQDGVARTSDEIEALHRRLLTARAGTLPAQRVADIVARPMTATRDAPVAAGRHPVVIYAPSLNSPAYENADLCEFLASHGYIVIASPSLGQRGQMTAEVEDLKAQVADIGFLIGYAASMPEADLGRLAVVGFSWGGLANVAAAARDSRVDALASLDGSIRFFPEAVAKIEYLTPASITVPYLMLNARSQALEDVNNPGVSRATSVPNKLIYTDLYRVIMNQMTHRDFASLFISFYPERVPGEYTRDELLTSYGWMSRYLVNFLDAKLKGAEAGEAFLTSQPASVGVPAHLVSPLIRRSQRSAPTRETLAQSLSAHGFATASAQYKAMREADPTFTLTEAELNAWGYQLLQRGRPADAVAILRLATELFPESSNAFDSLGEAQRTAGDQTGAIESFRQAVKLNPANANAASQLRQLGASSTT